MGGGDSPLMKTKAALQGARLLRWPRAGAYHRRGGRRPFRHFDLFNRRRRLWLWTAVDGALHSAAHGVRSVDVRAHRAGVGARSGERAAELLFAAIALVRLP